jgi:phosphoserine phosphatase
MKISTVITDVDGLLFPYDSKEQLAKQMLKDGTKNKLSLYFHGALTYMALKKVKKFHNAGDERLAAVWSKESYERFDKVIRGVDIDYIEKFGRKCAKDIPVEACETFENISSKGYELYAISGGITELTTAAFKKAGIEKYFNGIAANHILEDPGAGAKVHSLSKSISIPEDKLSVIDFSPMKTAAIGHDYYDITLLKNVAMPICKTGGKFDPEAYKIAKKKGYVIREFEQLQKIFK